MRGISYLFLVTAAVYVTIGMCWGIYMSIQQDFLTAPAHAHLNLVGWVTTALFGLYYHAVPKAGEARLAAIHYAIATLGIICFVPGIVIAVTQHNEVLVIIGSLLTVLSMLIFLFTVVRNRA